MVAPRTPGGQSIFVSSDYLSKVAPNARYGRQYGTKNGVQGAFLTQEQWKQLQGGTDTFAKSVIGTKAKQPKPPKAPKPPKLSTQGSAVTLPATASAPSAPAQVGLPGGVIRALSQYDVDRAALAVRARQADVARRNVFSQGLIGAGQMAADIYGGRSPAILGQAITGQQRQALVTAAEQAAQRQASELALQQALEGTLQQQYGMTSQRALEEAQRRGAMLSQIRAVGA